MTTDLWIEIAISILALWAVWKSLPKDPELDWKYFHSLLLVTDLRGDLEKKDASSEEWLQQIKNLIPYHPTYEDMSLLFADSDLDPAIQWQHLFQDSTIIEQHLMNDPAELGAGFSPASVIGWQDIAEKNDRVCEYLQRKLQHIIVVGQGENARQLVDLLGVEAFDQSLEIDALSQVLKRKEQRFLFVGEQAEAQEMLLFASQYPALRDRLLAMILIDAQFDEEWLNGNFTHEKMDAEANHAIPYLLWSHVKVDQLRPWQTLQEPEEPPSGWRSIEIIDLGAFPIQIKEHQKWMNQAACFVLVKRMELT